MVATDGSHLPGDWTTIYDVVKLGQTKAKELIELGTLHPQATAKTLKAAATMKAVPKASDDVVGVKQSAQQTHASFG